MLVRKWDREPAPGTDENRLHVGTGKDHADRGSVNLGGRQQARREGDWSTHFDTVENVFSGFEHRMVRICQHCGEAHLHRYLAEFDFRYNRRAALKISDAERAEDLLRMARDKRLTYRRAGEAANA